MSSLFGYSQKTTRDQKLRELENDIQRFTKACKSAWPRPMDYTNLIDAQYALRALKGS